jgi:hypothetical protein
MTAGTPARRALTGANAQPPYDGRSRPPVTLQARYRSSGGDRAAASTMLFEIAVSVDEQAREEHMESQVVVNNFYDHLLDEYESRSEPETKPSNRDENQLLVAPSVE